MQKYPNSTRARQATRLFPQHSMATKAQTKHLRKAWLKSIEVLGDRWLLADANRVTRKTI
jgi:hypothetical protein